MHKAGTCRIGIKRIANGTVRRYGEAVFLVGAIHVRWHDEAMPVNELGVAGFVDQFDGERHTLFHSNERAGGGAVIANGADGVIFRNFRNNRPDSELQVGWPAERSSGIGQMLFGGTLE